MSGRSPQVRVLGLYDVYVVLFILGGLGVVGRILWIQYVEGDALRRMGEDMAYIEESVPASRGNILSDDGSLLAASLPFFQLHVDMAVPQLTDSLFEADVDSLALGLYRVYGEQSVEGYRRSLREKRRQKRQYAWLASSKSLNYTQLQELRRYPLVRLSKNRGGVIVERHFQRYRPLGDLAARTIGSCSDAGCYGLEGAFSVELAGTPGWRLMQKSYGDKVVPVGSSDQVLPIDGYDVVTTLDVNLQDVATEALRRQLQLHKADHGCVVVMEVQSGAVKAIANLTLGKDGRYRDEVNYAVGASTEPGSTFKLAALIALLEDGKVELDDEVDTGDGRLRVYDHTIRDTKPGGYGKITVRKAWEVSSNVAVAKLVLDAYRGRENDFIKRLYSMRLHEPLGVEIQGEGKPYVKSPSDKSWSGVSLPKMSTGYEVKLTPLQILAFYNALANGGQMVRPRFVSGLSSHGEMVRVFPRVVLERSICSKSTVAKVCSVLEGVVSHGTARNLHGAVYTIAGKTGTAQVAQGRKGYRQGDSVRYQSSFVGFFPVDAPRYSCIVVVNSPRAQGYYGNVVAGPIFREIADKIYATRSEWFPRLESKGPMEAVASKSGSREELIGSFSGLGLPYKDASKRSRWVRTERRGGVTHLLPYRMEDDGVPNVQGMPLSDAVYLLENAGLQVRVRGRGTVRTQSVEPGARVQLGGVVWLEMSVQ